MNIERVLQSAVAGLLLASCGATEHAQSTAPAPTSIDHPPAARSESGGIEWELKVLPATVRIAERGSAVLRITATNRGSAAADTERDALALNVNGEDSQSFALAFGNGARDGRWASLPPGASVEEERVGLEIFDGLGGYELFLHRGEHVLARARVRVTE